MPPNTTRLATEGSTAARCAEPFSPGAIFGPRNTDGDAP